MPNIADILKAKWSDGNLHNRHRALGLTGNDSMIAYYTTELAKLSKSVVGALNDLIIRYWDAANKKGVTTTTTSNNFSIPSSWSDNDGYNNVLATQLSPIPLVDITSAVGADGSAVLNFWYTELGFAIDGLEYTVDGGVNWYVVPNPPAEIPFTTAEYFQVSSGVTIGGLENDTLCSMSLRAINGADPLTALVPASALWPVRPTATAAVPDAPTSLVATPGTHLTTVPAWSEVQINFVDGPAGTAAITNYQYTVNDGSTWSNVDSFTGPPASRICYISGLTASTSYTIALRAVNAVGASVASTSVTTTTLSSGFLGTGGTETTTGGYKYHVFTSSGTLTVTNSGDVEYLVVGGGGSGAPSLGSASGGGGGAGGYLTGTSLSITANQTITVGAGGAGVVGTGTAASGNNGSNSSIGSLVIALGGGKGGSTQSYGAGSGGSGGGKGVNSINTTPAGTGTSGQGNDGGDSQYSSSTSNAAGGGGGATSVGGSGSTSGTNVTNVGGAGGSGSAPAWISALTGIPTLFAGGGGGGIGGTTGTVGAGAAGGGNGGNTALNATSATANTGSGGGGAGRAVASPYYTSGAGGSGIVIIRYAI